MKPMMRFLVAPAMLLGMAAPAFANGVVQVWHCEMSEGATEEEIEGIAMEWIKAIKGMDGGSEATLQVMFPVAVNATGQVDFQVVLRLPSFTAWGKMWDNYQDDSQAALADERNKGLADCPDSAVWEVADLEAK